MLGMFGEMLANAVFVRLMENHWLVGLVVLARLFDNLLAVPRIMVGVIAAVSFTDILLIFLTPPTVFGIRAFPTGTVCGLPGRNVTALAGLAGEVGFQP